KEQPSSPLISVANLTKHYGGQRGPIAWLTGKPAINIHALNDVSFDIRRGETLGLIGESGCGKSTLGRTLLRLHEPTSGRVIFDDEDITNLDHAGLKAMRRHMQIIFQDPYASLNPRRTVADIIGLPLSLHNLVSGRRQMRDKVVEIMEKVGLKTNQLDRYPHQFSGGQRQRIGIARALISQPKFIV